MFDRLGAWLHRWGPILTLLVAEGIDLPTLGLVIAAWPAARLLSEPVFGWLADRTARVPTMVVVGGTRLQGRSTPSAAQAPATAR
jgi:MFS family permease